MPLSEDDRERVEAFLTYVEDFNAPDERYGQPHRHEWEDGLTVLTRFEAGPSCWLEVAVHPLIPQIRVAFVTEDRAKNEEVELAIEESEETVEELLQLGLEEAGLRWSDPPVEH